MQCRYELVNHKGTMLHTFTLQCPYTSPACERDGFSSKAMAQLCTKRGILFLTSRFSTKLLRMETRLSMNSRDAISTKKWSPPFLTRVRSQQSVLTLQSRKLHIGILVIQASLQCAHSIFLLDVERTWLDISNLVRSYILRTRWKQLRRCFIYESMIINHAGIMHIV